MNQTAKTSEYVVLVDDDNNELGTELKSVVHTDHTPLHRAFSIYIFNPKGELLTQQRNHDKKTWPGIWSNSCCGHPAPGEDTADAVRRRVQQELGIELHEIICILPDFRYRVELDGVVENELCPVYAACTDQEPESDPAEVAATKWVDWEEFIEDIQQPDTKYSPWAQLQVAEIVADDEIRQKIASICTL